jgi:hypothetical protein
VAIGVKETQDIIRQAVELSRSEPAAPARLDPQEAGMATGPRLRKRSLLRPGAAPEYLRPSAASETDEWQRLDDDIYKFLQLRKDQFGRLDGPPSQQFIAEMEAQLRFADPDYELGSYLGLLRLAADLDQTRQTSVTASEKGVFRAFARRITTGRKPGEAFDPDMVKRYLDLVDSSQPATWRGLADFFRLVARAARLPLIAAMREAPSLSIAVLLQVVDLATRFNQRSEGELEFQVGPMDVFLGARTVLHNRSVTQPTLAMVKELVLDETGLYHEDLLEWLRSVAVFGSEATLLIPGSLTEDGFTLHGARYSAVEMVMAAGERLARSPQMAGRAMATLSDAILFKIQQQDGHKDRQVQNILAHFNRLLHGERRSAARVSRERQQVRFDYVSAIQRAGELVKEIQTGQFRAVPPEGIEDPERPFAPVQRALPAAEAAPVAVSARPALAAARGRETPPPSSADGVSSAAILAGLLPREYERALSEWDGLIAKIRKRLSTKSPIFKSMVSQLAKVRAMDTCLVHGLTPSGGRLASRLGMLLQDEELRGRLGIDPLAVEALEDAFSLSHPRFLSSLEGLVLAVYGFREGLHGLQFRMRDRHGSSASAPEDGREGRLSGSDPADRGAFADGPAIPGGKASPDQGIGQGGRKADPRETVIWGDGADVDEPMLRLILGAILLGCDAESMRDGSASLRGAPPHRFQPDGSLRFPGPAELSTLGAGDPLLAYGSLLWVGRETLGQVPMGDLETTLMLMMRLTPEWRDSLFGRYRGLADASREEAAPRSPSGIVRRPGWENGCEMGFMGEIRHAYESAQGGAGLDSMLLAHLTAIQGDIDAACDALEAAKLRSSRERLLRCLE